MFFGSVQRMSGLDNQSKFQMFTIFPAAMLKDQGGSNMAAPSLRAESRKLKGDSASR